MAKLQCSKAFMMAVFLVSTTTVKSAQPPDPKLSYSTAQSDEEKKLDAKLDAVVKTAKEAMSGEDSCASDAKNLLEKVRAQHQAAIRKGETGAKIFKVNKMLDEAENICKELKYHRFLSMPDKDTSKFAQMNENGLGSWQPMKRAVVRRRDRLDKNATWIVSNVSSCRNPTSCPTRKCSKLETKPCFETDAWRMSPDEWAVIEQLDGKGNFQLRAIPDPGFPKDGNLLTSDWIPFDNFEMDEEWVSSGLQDEVKSCIDNRHYMMAFSRHARKAMTKIEKLQASKDCQMGCDELRQTELELQEHLLELSKSDGPIQLMRASVHYFDQICGRCLPIQGDDPYLSRRITEH